MGPIVDAFLGTHQPVADLGLTDLAGALRPLFPEWSADLPPALEPLDDARTARHRLFRALAELLRALHVDLLVVEDAHWADEVTLEFLLFLTSRQHSGGPSLVVTYRPEEVDDQSLLLRLSSRLPAGVTQLRVALTPLSRDQTAALVSSMLDGEPMSAEFSSFLHERTDGVPLAVEESVRLMCDRADLVFREGQWMRLSLSELQVAIPAHAGRRRGVRGDPPDRAPVPPSARRPSPGGGRPAARRAARPPFPGGGRDRAVDAVRRAGRASCLGIRQPHHCGRPARRPAVRRTASRAGHGTDRPNSSGGGAGPQGLAHQSMECPSPAAVRPCSCEQIRLLHGWWRDTLQALERNSMVELFFVHGALVRDGQWWWQRTADLVVGHSYGGTVIAEAGRNSAVAHLLYVSSYLPTSDSRRGRS